MLTLEKISKMLSIGLLVWLVTAVILIISFDLYHGIFAFVFITIMYISGLTSVNMMKKYYK